MQSGAHHGRVSAPFAQEATAPAQVHDELQSYDALIKKFRAAPTADWESMVSARRSELPLEFFHHMHARVQAAHVSGMVSRASSSWHGMDVGTDGETDCRPKMGSGAVKQLLRRISGGLQAKAVLFGSHRRGFPRATGAAGGEGAAPSPLVTWVAFIPEALNATVEDQGDSATSMNPDAQEEPEEQEALSTLAVQIVSLLEVLDKVAADGAAMDAAAAQFDDLLKARGRWDLFSV